MRLLFFFLFVALLSAHAEGTAQTVTISGKNLSLKQVFAVIKDQTGYVLLIPKGMLDKGKPVSVAIHGMPLAVALDIVLMDQPFNYTIRDKTIFLSSRENKAEKNVFGGTDIPVMINALMVVKGVVYDEEGEALQGATVKVKGSKLAVKTDVAGAFSIEVEKGQLLEISFVGYMTRIVVIDNNNSVIIRLNKENNVMNEVQIIGYGTTTKRLNTGTSSTVKSDVIEKQPVTNLLEALSGRVSGLFISQSSGMPGASPEVQIRGRNSISAGNQPLYIVDGIPFTGSPIDQLGDTYFTSPHGGNSPFNTLSPSDIESVTVLKDADATAIYGSRGSNGVILISTKKGTKGKTKFNANFSTGRSRVTRKLPMLNTAQYLEMRRQAFENDGATPDISSAPDLVLWDQNKYTDFQDYLIGNDASSVDAGAGVSGGNSQTSFLFSVNHHRETTVFPGDFSYKRTSFHLNADHSSLNNKFFFNASVIFTKDKNNLTGSDLTGAYNLPPNFPLFTSNGDLNWEGNLQNPLSVTQTPYEAKTTNFIGKATARYSILPGLDVKTSFGYSKIDLNQVQVFPIKAQNPAWSPRSVGLFSGNYIENIIIEPQADFRKTFGVHQISAVLGATYQQSSSVTPYMVVGENFSSDVLIYNLGAAGSYSSVLNSDKEYKYASGFGRLNYVLDNRYLLSLTYRRDASSRFGPGKQIGNFGSLGAGYIFTETELFKSKLPWISHGKIKGSYGNSGNDQIQDYGYLATYRITNYGYGSNSGIIPSRVANPQYSWEVTKKLEMTLDIGLFDDRLTLLANYFRNRTNNMLVRYPLSPQAGFTAYQANLPALVQNTGLELELNTINIKKSHFSWSSSFNITFPRNKLLSFPDLNTNSSYSNTYVVGQPLNLIILYRYTGVKDGLPTVEDINGDGSFSQGLAANGNGDFIIAGQSAPKLFGGFNNSLQYNGFQLDVFFQFVKQQGLGIRYYNAISQWSGLPDNVPGTMGNQDTKPLPPGFRPTTTYGSDAFNAYNDLYSFSDQMLSDASYIRLKNVSLSWSFPEKMMKKAGIADLRVFLSVQNLLTITNYDGFDPETQGVSLPPLKNLTIGIKCVF